jgi:protein O-GlcNAc transferase
MTAPQQLQSAISLHQAGLLSEAEAIYRQIVAATPDDPEAHHNLALVLKDQSRLDEAIAAYGKAIELAPRRPDLHYNLAIALAAKGQHESAAESYRQAIHLQPDLVLAHTNLGNTLLQLGRLDDAIDSYRSATRIRPDYADAHFNLAIALKAQRKLPEAINEFHRALALRPDWPQAHGNLGTSLLQLGQIDDAIESYRKAAQLRPTDADAHFNLANALYRARKYDDAVTELRRAVELRPNWPEAWCDLGNALRAGGKLDDAIAAFRQALALRPDLAAAHSSLIFTLHYHPACTAGMIREELIRWNSLHAEPLKKFIRPHQNTPDPNRPLRVGYVSPDFREHIVAQMLLPVIRGHNRRNVSVYCYSNVRRPDAITRLFQSHADHWRDISDLDDENAAAQIQRDAIDILVDLSLHTAANRLPLFARKPAPVQVTYLAYCGSSGLEAMDYRLSDPHLDPLTTPSPGIPGEGWGGGPPYTEKTIRLPRTYWLFNLPMPTPDVAPPPSITAGRITFGSLNDPVKISTPALDLWSQILQRVPNSRLLLHCNTRTQQNAITSHLARHAVAANRISFVPRTTWLQYLESFSRIDIALDPTPFGGGVTTCDTLWMGVPVVTLSGATAVGRGGRSILSNVGLPELVAQTPEQYVQIAATLATNPARLRELRSTLRDRMKSSPLMDAAGFVADIENAYRQIWQEWCAKQSG